MRRGGCLGEGEVPGVGLRLVPFCVFWLFCFYYFLFLDRWEGGEIVLRVVLGSIGGFFWILLFLKTLGITYVYD